VSQRESRSGAVMGGIVTGKKVSGFKFHVSRLKCRHALIRVILKPET